MRQKGFTLVELLVVIAILAVLAVVGFSAFRGFGGRADDSTRQGDIDSIFKAYEGHYDFANGQYPLLQADWFGSGKIPTPPEGGEYQGLLTSASTEGYQICAKLNGHNPLEACDPTIATCYCRTSSLDDYAAPSATPAPTESPEPSEEPPPPSPSPTPTPPPATCSLVSASWSLSSVQEGTLVTLTTVGDSNCSNSDTMAFDIRANVPMWPDRDFSPDPTPVFDDPSKTWTTSWATIYESGAPASNGYFFNALLNSEPEYRSADPLLEVTQTPNSPPTCTSIDGLASVTTDQSTNYNVTANDSDGTITGYAWTASGGSPTSQDNGSGTLNWTAPSTSGSVNIDLTVTDDDGATAVCPTKTVTVAAADVDVTRPPGTSSNNTSYGSIAWVSTHLISVDENFNASLNTSGLTASNYLRGENFGFSIPTGATIKGIRVEVQKFRSGGTTGAVRDNRLRLIKGGVIETTDKAATSINWPTTETAVIYGTSSDLWGSTWTPADINSSNFGVVLAVAGSTSTANRIANVDIIRVTVTYTP